MADDHSKNLHDLYNQAYVDQFERVQTPSRISRLMHYFTFPKDSDVADFGCGNGMLLSCIHRRVRTYSGVDFSEDFITAAKKQQKKSGIVNADFFCESIESFCSRSHDKFDAGFVLDLAEHVPDKEWAGILSAIHSSIKPGGKLYLHTPNADFFLEIMKKKNVIFHQFKEHVAVRDVHQNSRMLEDAGFISLEVILVPHYNILRFMHVLSFLPFVGKFFSARIFIIADKEK